MLCASIKSKASILWKQTSNKRVNEIIKDCDILFDGCEQGKSDVEKLICWESSECPSEELLFQAISEKRGQN